MSFINHQHLLTLQKEKKLHRKHNDSVAKPITNRFQVLKRNAQPQSKNIQESEQILKSLIF